MYNNSFFLRSINDGILEVAGLYSALHIARLQVNMADPLRLGQAKTIKVSGLQQDTCYVYLYLLFVLERE